MSIKNAKERARAENAVLRFLVERCDEAPELETAGTDLTGAYAEFSRRKRNEVPYLFGYFLYKLLVEAGFTKKTRDEKGPKGNPKRVVYFRGVGLRKTPLIPAVLPSDAEVRKFEGGSLHPNASSHVRINGVLYDRGMIATVKPIRGFKKYGSEEEMKAIVTFNNAELRHQFVSSSEAKRIEQQLLCVEEAGK